MAGPNLTERKPHDEAEELLPWYASGQLDEADRSRVEKHLSSCAFCRQQLVLERQLIDEFQAMTPEVESGWARLRSRVQAPTPMRQRRPNPLAEFWDFVTRPAIAGLAAAQIAFPSITRSVRLPSPYRPTSLSCSAPTRRSTTFAAPSSRLEPRSSTGQRPPTLIFFTSRRNGARGRSPGCSPTTTSKWPSQSTEPDHDVEPALAAPRAGAGRIRG